MPTTVSQRELPNTIGPLALAIASAVAMAGAMSGTGNDVMDTVVLLAFVAGVVLSTRYSIRTYRRLSDHEFEVAHLPRWLMTILALAINGLVCFMVGGMALLFLGVLMTGKGVAG